MALQKSWLIKVFAQDGITLKLNIPNFSLASNPSFKTRINGGQGECVLDLVGSGFTFDSFGENSTLAFSYIVEIWCIDANNPLGRRIYKGYISRMEPYIDTDSNEGVRVTCLGLVSLLSRSYYKNGSSYTVVQSAVDPETIGKAIIDHFNTIYGGSLLGYSGTTQTVGTNVTYTFTDQKWLEAITTVGTLAGTDWWWLIDQDGKYNFKAKPGSPTWTFTLGRDINSITVTKDAEAVINDIEVRYVGGGTYDTSDATSQTTYGTGSPATGKSSEIITDSSLASSAAQQRGDKELADNKTAKVSAVIVLNTTADLEGIRVGDCCNVRNFALGSTTLSDNLQIVSTSYDGDTLTIELDAITHDLGTALQNFVAG